MKNTFLILAVVALIASCSPSTTDVVVPTVDTTLVNTDTTEIITNSVVTLSVAETAATSVVTSTK